jgi:hypothetical protein
MSWRNLIALAPAVTGEKGTPADAVGWGLGAAAVGFIWFLIGRSSVFKSFRERTLSRMPRWWPRLPDSYFVVMPLVFAAIGLTVAGIGIAATVH